MEHEGGNARSLKSAAVALGVVAALALGVLGVQFALASRPIAPAETSSGSAVAQAEQATADAQVAQGTQGATSAEQAQDAQAVQDAPNPRGAQDAQGTQGEPGAQGGRVKSLLRAAKDAETERARNETLEEARQRLIDEAYAALGVSDSARYVSDRPYADLVDAEPDSDEAALDEEALHSRAIMGETLCGAWAMAAVYKERGAVYPSDVYAEAGAPTIDDFCRLCVEEARIEGVRAEVLFAQAMHETAWLQFGNQVSVEQCNFGGLGAVNSGGAGESFPDVATGLRAQVQHLKAYASTDSLEGELVDTRFDLVERGCAPTVDDLGGRWAWPGDGYGDAIFAIMEAVAAHMLASG